MPGGLLQRCCCVRLVRPGPRWCFVVGGRGRGAERRGEIPMVGLGASSGLWKAFFSSASPRAGFSAGARPGLFGAVGKAGLLTPAAPLLCGARLPCAGQSLGPKVEREERQGPGRFPGRDSEVHHQPPSRCLRRFVPRSSIWEHRDFWGLRSSLTGCLRSFNSGFYA